MLLDDKAAGKDAHSRTGRGRRHVLNRRFSAPIIFGITEDMRAACAENFSFPAFRAYSETLLNRLVIVRRHHRSTALWLCKQTGGRCPFFPHSQPPLLGRGQIQIEIVVKNNTVERLDDVRRHKPVLDITSHQLGIALQWIAISAAASELHEKYVVLLKLDAAIGQRSSVAAEHIKIARDLILAQRVSNRRIRHMDEHAR